VFGTHHLPCKKQECVCATVIAVLSVTLLTDLWKCSICRTKFCGFF